MLKLVRLERKDMPKLLDMMDEWTASGEKIIPYAIRREDYHDFDRYVKTLEIEAEAEGLGLERVLMVCDKSNIASAKTIMKNGGVLENEVQVDGVVHQRYWIDLG